MDEQMPTGQDELLEDDGQSFKEEVKLSDRPEKSPRQQKQKPQPPNMHEASGTQHRLSNFLRQDALLGPDDLPATVPKPRRPPTAAEPVVSALSSSGTTSPRELMHRERMSIMYRHSESSEGSGSGAGSSTVFDDAELSGLEFQKLPASDNESDSERKISVGAARRFEEQADRVGSIERRTVYLGLLFLLVMITGDTLRMVTERQAIAYSGSRGAAASRVVGYDYYVFGLTVSSNVSMVGVLGMVLIFVLGTKVGHTSRILLHPHIGMMRAITSDERRLVKLLLQGPSAATAAASAKTKAAETSKT